MSLNGSGAISLAGSTTGQSIAIELNKSSTGVISLNDTDVRTLGGKASGSIVMPTDFWGKSSWAPWVQRTQPLTFSSTSGGSLSYIAAATPYIALTGFQSSTNFGYISTSTDGVTWSSVYTGINTSGIKDITLIGSTYVMLNTGGVYTSSAITGPWTLRLEDSTFSGRTLGRMFKLGSLLAVTGSTNSTVSPYTRTGGALWTSTNGTTWTQRTIPNSSDATLNAIAYSGSAYVAVGGGYNDYTAHYIITSTDGVTWTQQSITGYDVGGAGNIAIGWIVWDGGYFIIHKPGGVNESNGGIWRSFPSGAGVPAAWQKIDSAYSVAQETYPSFRIIDSSLNVPKDTIIFVPNTSSYVNPADEGDIYVSKDHGSTWLLNKVNSNDNIVLSAYFNSKWIIADSTGRVWTQDDP